jgi:hypothetical protein
VLDDGALMPETETIEEASVSVEEAAGPEPEPTESEAPKGKSEPGWIKKRIESGVEKQLNQRLADMEARIRAGYEEQLKPLREAAIEREADKLVADGTIKTKELALEYARYKAGQPMPEPKAPAAPARDTQGKFAPQAPTPEIREYALTLKAQADTIKALGGPDMWAIYRADPEVQRRIVNRETDFANLAKEYEGVPTPGVPAPVRSANQGGIPPTRIDRLSKDQWKRLNEYLENGGKVDGR